MMPSVSSKLNNNSHSYQTSEVNSHISSSVSHPHDQSLLAMHKQTKNNIEDINLSLLKKFELMQQENANLSDAISELSNDNREKEEALEESHKIITKLNDEYSKLIKEFQNLQQLSSESHNENLKSRKTIEDCIRNEQRLLKENQNLRENLIKDNPASISLRKEVNLLKKDSQALTGKLEKEIRDKSELKNNLDQKMEEMAFLIQEKDNLINTYESKINKLTQEMNKKEEDLNNLVSFSKQIENENKFNIDEMTKQAINTIKLFYSSIKANSSCENKELSYSDSVVNVKDFLKMVEEGKVSFLVESALVQNELHLDKQGLNSLNNLNTNSISFPNLKNELIKTELYSSLLREINLVKMIDEQANFLNLTCNNLSDEDATFLETVINHLKFLKEINSNLQNKNCELENENKNIKKQIEENGNNQYENDNYLNQISSLKDGIKDFTHNVKTKFENLQNLNFALQDEIKLLKEEKMEIEEKLLNLEDLKSDFNNSENHFNENNKYMLKNSIDHKFYTINKTADFNIKGNINIVSNLNNSNYSTTSYNEKNYSKKKEENEKLKDEILRLKEEITSLIISNKKNSISNQSKNLNSNKTIFSNLKIDSKNSELQIINKIKFVNSNYNLYNQESFKKISEEDNSIRKNLNFNYNSDNNLFDSNFNKKSNEFENQFPFSENKLTALYTYYISYEMDMDKAHTKIEDVLNKFRNVERSLISEDEKKIKLSQVKEIISGVHKLVSLFSVFVNKYYKDLHYNTSQLKKLFEFIKSLNKIRESKMNSNNSQSKQIVLNLENNFHPKNCLKIFYETNSSLFVPDELDCIYSIYINKSPFEILNLFQSHAEFILTNPKEKLNLDTENSEFGDLSNYDRRVADTNYKIVNDQVIRLKKFEFDFVHSVQILKHFLVAQEVLYKKIIHEEYVNMNYDKKTNAMIINIIDKLIKSTEDYLKDHNEESSSFIKRLALKLLKNQNYFLELTFS